MSAGDEKYASDVETPKASSESQEAATASTEPAPQSANPRHRVKRKASISEEATAASSRRFVAPSPVRCIVETPFRTVNPTTQTVLEEATGWAMDASARGPLNTAGSFIGTAILRLALKEANCRNPLKCDARVYGLKPGSMLTTATVITGVASAIFMPIVGAVVDHTRYRKLVGITTAVAVCAITGVQISISEDTWFAVLILEIIGGFCLIAHTTAAMSYLPDLTEIEADLAHYTSRFNMTQYAFQFCFSGLITGLTYAPALKSDDPVAGTVKTAKMAAATAFGLSSFYLGYAWTFLFRKRPALSKVPDGENIINTGFKQIWKTAKAIWTKYHALRWFMIALLWSPEAGAGVVLSIAVTFLTVQIGFTGGEIGFVQLILLAATLPGSAFAKWFILRFNPLLSFRLSLVFFAASVGPTCAVLSGPDMKKWTYLFSILWGLSYGWIFPAQRVMQCTLIPKGQNNEIMGFFSFCAQILGWLPALLFSIMNEKGVDMRWGMALISFFICLAIFFTFFIGDYDKAVAQVASENEQEEERVRNQWKLEDASGERFEDELEVEVAPQAP